MSPSPIGPPLLQDSPLNQAPLSTNPPTYFVSLCNEPPPSYKPPLYKVPISDKLPSLKARLSESPLSESPPL